MSQGIDGNKGVSTNKNHRDVGSLVSRVRQALMFPEGMWEAVDMSVMLVMCPRASHLVVSQMNQGVNTRATCRCRHFQSFPSLMEKQLSGVDLFSNFASWQNPADGHCGRSETGCWDVCEGRPSPMCRVPQRQNEGIMMPWRISSIKGMGSWCCQLQPDDICSQWGKKRLKAWMTLLTVC